MTTCGHHSRLWPPLVLISCPCSVALLPILPITSNLQLIGERPRGIERAVISPPITYHCSCVHCITASGSVRINSIRTGTLPPDRYLIVRHHLYIPSCSHRAPRRRGTPSITHHSIGYTHHFRKEASRRDRHHRTESRPNQWRIVGGMRLGLSIRHALSPVSKRQVMDRRMERTAIYAIGLLGVARETTIINDLLREKGLAAAIETSWGHPHINGSSVQ